MNHHQTHCERCGTDLAGAYTTTAYSATGLTMQVAPDGTAATFGLGGFVACSWNCLAVLAAQRAGSTADAAVRIVAERERQVTAEGWSPEHDASHPEGELALAGICYAAEHVQNRVEPEWREMWPWDTEWWKPKGRERDLVRAGALLAAELDRDPSGRRVTEERF